MNPPTCPTQDELKSFSAGRLPDELAIELGRHVDQCSPCQRTLETLADSGDTLVLAMQRPAPADDYQREPGYQRVESAIAAIGRDPSFVARPVSPTGAATQSHELGIVGQYRLLEKLGEGGMGAVYKALHVRLEKVVALKVLPAERMQDRRAVARFEREMKAVGQLNHPNIVGAFDAGEADGKHYLVMELVDGCDLSTLLRRRGPLNAADACELVRQAAVGLQHAHRRGMVHRDIKPSNLMLARSEAGPPQVKILDMGLALLGEQHASGQRELTNTGQLMGTLQYMAPEQALDSHDVDIRADIYSLGASLYKLLCGETPFPSGKYDTPVKMMMALATETAPSIGTKCVLPTGLVAVVDRMLARQPDDRFGTPQEVADALRPFAHGSDLRKLLDAAPPDSHRAATGHSLAPTSDHATPASADTSPRIDSGQRQQAEVPIAPPAAAIPPRYEPRPPAAPPVQPPRSKPIPRPAKPPSQRSSTAAPVIDPKTPTPVALRANRATSPARPWFLFLGVVAIAASLAGIILLGVLFMLRTPKGTISVAVADEYADQIKILATGDGREVVIGKDDGWEVKIREGEYQVALIGGDEQLTLEPQMVTVRKGEEVKVTVQVKPSGAGGLRERVLGDSDRPLAERIESRLAKLPPRRLPPFRQPPDEPDNADNAEPAPVQPPTAPPRLPAPAGHALSFGGARSYVEIPTLAYDGKTPITIEALLDLEGGNEMVIASNTGAKGIELSVREGQWSLRASKGIFSLRAVGRGVATGAVYVAAVWDGDKKMGIYVDGKPLPLAVGGGGGFGGGGGGGFGGGGRVGGGGRIGGGGGGRVRGPAVAADEPFLIGAEQTSDGAIQKQFHGRFRGLRISNVAREPAELTPTDQFKVDGDTLALYDFSKGAGDKLVPCQSEI